MRKGFIFNHDLCVRCQACSAACILENGWNVKPRTVYQVNPDTLLSIPVINISMACNHCEKPACLEGCPAGAFYREESSGAILINGLKCLGCNYCICNCPYDSPKTDLENKVL
jgi:anaerobic dimethyl sulfoxide reductase subunit B (iron-sulfur subunit)